jgi:NAD(P)H-hydrate repair Nnr-like enzyme with NAD(P)H-hydrate dehydratase domain
LHTTAAAAAYAHAVAGDRAAPEGERGMIASDLISALRGVLNPNDGTRSTADS